jgi:hypothetical protein
MKTITKASYAALILGSLGVPLIAFATDTGSVLPNGNTADGDGVLFSRTTGIANSGFGFQSLFHDTSGSYNTATGYRALFNDTTGYSNTAAGFEALYSDSTGIRNTAVGNGALLHNNGSSNTATGWAALFTSTVGTRDTATGYQALFSNTMGNDNTADGYQALFTNKTINGVTGNFNTAIGSQALSGNATGSNNTAIGYRALQNKSSGDNNIAIGFGALSSLTSGQSNIGIGGGTSLTTGSDNIYIDVPANGITTESNTIRIGSIFQTKTFIGGIWNTSEGGSNIEAVYINSDGQLGTQAPPSSRRFKKDIASMDKTSEAILSLRPVTFHYKDDNKGTPQFGLIAEDVAAVDPDLIVRDPKGEIYSVRYDAVNAMLLNEFLKEHRRVEDQQKHIERLEAELKEQKALIKQVSDTLELSKPAAPQLAISR